MKKLFLGCLLAPLLARAQVLSGQVQDVAGRPVPYASVAAPALRQGTTADAAGYFTLPTLPPGPQRLEVSAVGYATVSRVLPLPMAKVVIIKLQAAEKAISEVVVTGVSRRTEIRRSPVPIAALSQREMRLSASTNVIDAARTSCTWATAGFSPNFRCKRMWTCSGKAKIGRLARRFFTTTSIILFARRGFSTPRASPWKWCPATPPTSTSRRPPASTAAKLASTCTQPPCPG